MEYILELKNIIKLYPGVRALNNVNISVEKGEIHALMGENGAGKSTLIKICSGAIVPTGGQIIYEGKEFSHFTPALSMMYGINVIYQEFNLVNELSVLDNIFLGNYPKKNKMIDRSAMRRKAQEVLGQLGIEMDLNARVKDLSVGYKQFIEIAKAVSKKTKVLIMDEPSAPLTNKEVDILLKIVRRLKVNGVTVIYISHRLEEVFQISDRISVLRDGEYIKTIKTKDATQGELVRLMVGREITETYPKRQQPGKNAETIFAMKSVFGNGLENISFELKKGEILGLGGIVGAGRTELAQMICGLVRPDSGEMYYKGTRYQPRSSKEAMKKGIALAPEDRKQQGLILGLSIKENINLSSYRKVSRGMVISSKGEKRAAETFRKELCIKTPTINQKVVNLSGGNQQKVVLARLLALNAEVIIFDEPTRGIDVGAKQEVYQLMNRLIKEGKTIIMISSEMPELIGMSDRILVLSEGRITGELEREEFSQDRIMQYASVTSKLGGTS